ncbi:MAG: hypothetical protein V1735_04555 [Nanoarchaeota archaeon]
MDYYESNLQNRDVEELDKRIVFFSRFIDVVDILVTEFPRRWPILKSKIGKIQPPNTKKRFKFTHYWDKDLLMNDLRDINSQVLFSTQLFEDLKLLIQNWEVPTNCVTIKFLQDLVDGERPGIWPEFLYKFLVEAMDQPLA